jgi:tetratricopeptide (TPR) repeat protein
LVVHARPPATRGGRASLFGVWLVAAVAVIPQPSLAAAAPDSLRMLLAGTKADSLPVALRRFEARHARGPEATEAVLALGQFHYARGEYRRAADAFARAAARLEPARKSEARYWAGLAWLALGASNQARAALDEVASTSGPRQAGAMLGQAQAWELAQRPGPAGEVLAELLAGEPGETGPAALERVAVIADREGDEAGARKARERLLREYPRSVEAAAARRAVFTATGGRPQAEARPGASAVVIGSFADPARARSLAAAARAAGFAEAQVVSRGEGLAAVHLVRLGVYPRPADAQRAGEQAGQALGVTFELARVQ